METRIVHTRLFTFRNIFCAWTMTLLWMPLHAWGQPIGVPDPDSPPSVSLADRADLALAEAVEKSLHSPRGLLVWTGDVTPILAVAVSRGRHLVQVRPRVAQPDDVDMTQRHQEFRKFVRAADAVGRVTIDRLDPNQPWPYSPRSLNGLVFDDPPDEATWTAAIESLQPDGVVWVRTPTEAASRARLAKVAGAPAEVHQWTPPNSQGTTVWLWTRKQRSASLDTWSHVRHGADRNAVSSDREVETPRNLRWVGGNLWPRGYRRSAVPAITVGTRQMVYVLQDEVPEHGGMTRRDSLVARDAFNGLPLWKLPSDSYRMATLGERLFVTKSGKVVERSARTGEVVRTFDTDVPFDFVVVGETLVVQESRQITAWNTETGERRWVYEGAANGVAADEQRVYLQVDRSRRGGASELVALSLADGELQWQLPTDKVSDRSVKLVLVYEDVAVLADYRGNYVVDAATGERLWDQRYNLIGHGGSYEKVLGVEGRIWIHVAKASPFKDVVTGELPQGRHNAWVGLNRRTGAQERLLAQPDDFHSKHRCSFDVATGRHMLCGTMDFADIQTGQYTHYGAARNSCSAAGVAPANGLVYSFPHACGCYPMLRGMLALSGDTQVDAADIDEEPVTARVEHGPAWSDQRDALQPAEHSEWRVYRGDNKRSGGATFGSPAAPRTFRIRWRKQMISEDWEALLPWEWRQRESPRLTQVVQHQGRRLIADTDGHRIVCLRGADGAALWEHIAESRIEGPPTVWGDWCLFGTRGGILTVLRVSDGALAWRTEVVAGSQAIIAHGQLESANPVRGVVLAERGIVHVLTGRHADEGRGLWMHAYQIEDGQLLGRRHVQWQQTPDVITSDGKLLQMGDWRVMLTGAAPPNNKWRALIRGGKLGLQDNTWYRRPIAMRKDLQAWTLGKQAEGQLLCFDEQRAYSYEAAGKVLGVNGMLFGKAVLRGKPRSDVAGVPNWKAWETNTMNASRVSGMVLADDSLYVAGEFQSSLLSSRTAQLRRYDAATGKQLATLDLPSRPVHDGMSCCDGQLMLALLDGQVLCVEDGGQ